jgi:hypothetical protein
VKVIYPPVADHRWMLRLIEQAEIRASEQTV